MAKGGNQQVAALCWRTRKGKREVLLITSRETKRWVIPKGWPMEGFKDYNAARQEAWEEAGVRGRMTRAPLGRFSYVKQLKSGALKTVRVTVYGMAVVQVASTWPEKSERKRTWYSGKNAATLVAEVGLKRILIRLSKSVIPTAGGTQAYDQRSV